MPVPQYNLSDSAMSRRLVYYVACTIDGYIARADGSRDWALPDGEHFADLIAK